MFPDKARRIGFEPGPEGDVSIDLYPDVEVRRTYFVAADVLEEPFGTRFDRHASGAGACP